MYSLVLVSVSERLRLHFHIFRRSKVSGICSEDVNTNMLSPSTAAFDEAIQ